jgi:hypothetical protein
LQLVSSAEIDSVDAVAAEAGDSLDLPARVLLVLLAKQRRILLTEVPAVEIAVAVADDDTAAAAAAAAGMSA